MRRAVVDAGVLVGWFESGSPHQAMRSEYEAGALTVVGPRGLVAEALGLLAERDGLSSERLTLIGVELERAGLQLQDPPMPELATWLERGLAPHRATYPALAASLDVPLVTDDPELRRIAGDLL